MVLYTYDQAAKALNGASVVHYSMKVEVVLGEPQPSLYCYRFDSFMDELR